MSNRDHQKIFSALYFALKPFAKMLLNVGIGYKEFSDIAKCVFVQVSREEFGVRGRPTNSSRIAAMNGLSRKEVSKLKDEDSTDLRELLTQSSVLSKMLHEWATNPKYLDHEQNPLMLPYSDAMVSFETLVESLSCDIPPGAIKSELIRVGAVIEMPDNKIKLLSRSFVPSDAADKMVLGLSNFCRLANTVAFNSGKDGQEAARFERVTVIDDFPIDRLDFVEVEASKKLEKITEDIDSWLAMESSNGKKPTQGFRVGVGMYLFELTDSDFPEDR
ncbi:MAG: DUF6502 family protein [bacterium]